MIKHLALVIALVGCNNSKPTAEPAAAKPTEAAPVVAPPPAPETYTSNLGRFTQTVTFGAVREKELDDPNGGHWHSARWDRPTGLYEVQYTDYADHAEAWAEVKSLIPTRDNAAIKRDENIHRDGREGRELEFKMNDRVTIYMRLLIEGKRVYKSVAGVTTDPESAHRFLDGLRIL